ncbi:MAG TPA: hypothetical protein VF017_09195 [Thermoanaerobaculia bacterium]|nr:hypothetical protein [Thermoanaerobaculia bacterium]
MRQDVLEARDLCFFLLADHDGPVATSPDLASPLVKATDLLGEIGVEVGHEEGELPGVLRRGEQVVVIGHEGEHVDPEAVAPLSTAQNAEDQIVESGAWAQQRALLKGAAGDLDHVAGR